MRGSASWVARAPWCGVALAAALGLGAAGCGGPLRVAAPADAPALLGDDWFAARAAQLGITPEAARARDAALPEDRPPARYGEDAALAREAGALWHELCAKCHGEDGAPPKDAELKVRPRTWGTFGTKMGFLFGGDGMRAGIYRRIRDGGEPRGGEASEMVAWGDQLSREQLWALVALVESL